MSRTIPVENHTLEHDSQISRWRDAEVLIPPRAAVPVFRREGALVIEKLVTLHADVYLVYPRSATPDNWAYGGMRILGHTMGVEPHQVIAPKSLSYNGSVDSFQWLVEGRAIQELLSLGLFESGIKQALINSAIGNQAIERIKESALQAEFADAQPHLDANKREAFFASLNREICGGRGVILPRTEFAEQALRNPSHAAHSEIIELTLGPIASRLNQLDGRLKLTPDLGVNAPLAAIMLRHTPHVLGIPADSGGAGAKSSYSVSSIAGVLERLDLLKCPEDTPVSILGAGGSLGSQLVTVLGPRFHNVEVCDLKYDRDDAIPLLAPGWTKITADPDRFPERIMKRGGIIISTGIRQELSNSEWQLIPEGSVVLLAQNHGIPRGVRGLALTRALHERKVTVIPGPILTLGGALTSRLEWAWRELHPTGEETTPFPKWLAHIAAREVSGLLASLVTIDDSTTPYERMLELAGLHPGSGQKRMWEAA